LEGEGQSVTSHHQPTPDPPSKFASVVVPFPSEKRANVPSPKFRRSIVENGGGGEEEG
jgi:hypothetical protein